MTVLAELDGHPFDLDALARHFPTGNPRLVVSSEGTFLATDDLDHAFSEAGRMVEIANAHLRGSTAGATPGDAGYRPVRLGSKFQRESAPLRPARPRERGITSPRQLDHCSGDAVEARGAAFDVAAVVTDGVPVAPPPPAGPRVLARRNRDVDDLLAIVAKAERLSWPQLYKVFEIVRDAIGGGRAGLVATGWTTKADLNAFTGSADHYLVSGIHEGRHARGSGAPPKRTVTLDEAQTYIRDLARRWLDSLS